MPSKKPRTSITHDSQEAKDRFDKVRKSVGLDTGEFIEFLLDTYENYKSLEIDSEDAGKKHSEGEIIYLSPEKVEFFEGTREREKKLRDIVKESLDLDCLEMTEGEFLNLAIKTTGQSKNHIVTKSLKSYCQTIIAKEVKGKGGLGSQDDVITSQVKTLAEMINAGTLPQFSKVTLTTISQFTSKNYNTIKGWAERQNVLEMIKDKDHYVSKENLEEFLAKLK